MPAVIKTSGLFGHTDVDFRHQISFLNLSYLIHDMLDVSIVDDIAKKRRDIFLKTTNMYKHNILYQCIFFFFTTKKTDVPFVLLLNEFNSSQTGDNREWKDNGVKRRGSVSLFIYCDIIYTVFL